MTKISRWILHSTVLLHMCSWCLLFIIVVALHRVTLRCPLILYPLCTSLKPPNNQPNKPTTKQNKKQQTNPDADELSPVSTSSFQKGALITFWAHYLFFFMQLSWLCVFMSIQYLVFQVFLRTLWYIMFLNSPVLLLALQAEMMVLQWDRELWHSSSEDEFSTLT